MQAIYNPTGSCEHQLAETSLLIKRVNDSGKIRSNNKRPKYNNTAVVIAVGHINTHVPFVYHLELRISVSVTSQ
jgi:hypothetical protein